VARARHVYEGLDEIAERLRRNAPDIGYIVLVDRTDRRTNETLGRFDFDESSALPWLSEPEDAAPEADGGYRRLFLDTDPGEPGDPDSPDDDDTDPSEEDDDDDREVAPTWSPSDRGPIPMRFIADAAVRWIKDLAARCTVGERFRRFRIKVCSPKGHRQIDSGQFVCRNLAYEHTVEAADEAIADLRIPEPDLDRAERAGMAKGIQALGDYYAQWGQIVLGSMGQLQHVNNAMLSRLHVQLSESRGQVDELVAAMLESRIAEARLDNQRKSDETAADARTLLAQQALQQLGDAAKAFLTAKGVNPEMADVLGAIGQSPELVQTLTDPDVKALMQDPTNLQALAGMLKQAAAQARAMRQAATQPPSP